MSVAELNFERVAAFRQGRRDPRPHITMLGGSWHCYGGRAYGNGATKIAAYSDWLLDYVLRRP